VPPIKSTGSAIRDTLRSHYSKCEIYYTEIVTGFVAVARGKRHEKKWGRHSGPLQWNFFPRRKKNPASNVCIMST